MWAAVPLVVLVAYAFWPALGNRFVNWDDETNFVRNPHFRGLGIAQLRWAWTTFWLAVYQPLGWMLLEVQYTVFGLNPWGYHLVSVGWHAVNSIVLYFLSLALLRRARPDVWQERPATCSVSAGVATALFAIHPLRAEVVAWASSQTYLPCAFFYWMALSFYLSAFPATGITVRPRFWMAFVSFAAALLSKAPAVSLPFVLLVLDVYPLKRLAVSNDQRFGRRFIDLCVEKIPFFALSALFMALALASKPHDPVISVGDPAAFWYARLGRASYGIWFYLVKTVWPFALTAFYAAGEGTSPLEFRFVASAAATVVVTAVAVRYRRSHPGILAVWVSYVLILLPSLGVVPITTRLAADRYSYLPMVAIVALCAGTLSANWRWWPTRIGPTAACTIAVAGVVAALIVLTRAQCRTWQSSEALWTHALNHGGDQVPDVQNAVGLLLLERGELNDARWHFEEAIRLDPRYSQSHTNLGTILARLGQLSAAKSKFVEAIRLAPTEPSAHNNLGTILLGEGHVELAMREYLKAVRLDPDGASVESLEDFLLVRRSTIAPILVPLIGAVVSNPRDRRALQALEDALPTVSQ